MNAQQLKNAILQEAIEGRLVPQDPNDEPASVLLTRIRQEKEQLVKEGKLKKKDLVVKPISEDEIPFDIPDNWEWVRLGEISTYANTKKKINAATAAPELWGLDLEDIEKGGRILSFKSVGERKAIGDKTYFYEGDILYSKLRPYLLKILVAPRDGICTPEIIPFTCYGGICKEYIVNLLKSAYVDDYINSVTFGVKMPRVSTDTMTSLVLPLPPIAEQKRIVEKIEELLPKVEEYGKAQDALNKLNAELPERLKKSILQEAIEGRLVPQDPNDEPASVLLAKIRQEKEQLVNEGKLKKKDLVVTPISEDEIPFDIPDSWEWCRVGDLFLHASGKQQSSNNKNVGTLQKYITTSNLYWSKFVLDTLKEMYFTDEELKTCSAQKGDLLVCEGGAGYGRSAIWPYEYNICLQNHVHRLRPLIDGMCEYIYYLIYLLKESNRLASVGTAMPGLSANRLKELLVPLPPLAEQKRIVAKIEKVFTEIGKLKM